MTRKWKKGVNRIMKMAMAIVTIILVSFVAINEIGQIIKQSLKANLSITVDGSISQVLNNQINEASKIVRRKSLLCILNSRPEKYMDGVIMVMDN